MRGRKKYITYEVMGRGMIWRRSRRIWRGRKRGTRQEGEMTTKTQKWEPHAYASYDNNEDDGNAVTKTVQCGL